MHQIPEPDWQTVLAEVADQKRRALKALVQSHMINKGKRSGSGSSALVQSALAQALRHPHTQEIESHDQMFRWIGRFVLNKCSNEIARFRRRKTLTIQPDTAEQIGRRMIESRDFDDELFSELRPCLDQLDPDQALIVALKLASWRYEQIGAELDPPRTPEQIAHSWQHIVKTLRECAKRRGLTEPEQ